MAISRTTTIYRCEHCSGRKAYLSKRGVNAHEAHCPYNKDRIPRIGELYGKDTYYFLHPESINIPSNPGVIWDGKQWLVVPEYDGEHGDDWPYAEYKDGTREGYVPKAYLEKIHPSDRLKALRYTFVHLVQVTGGQRS